MRIIVCIKQIPAVAEVRFDVEKKTIVRDGVTLQVNTFDRKAVTAGIAIKERFGGEVVAMTMGPPQARDALVECLAIGADRAVHLLDTKFAGSDTLATARALSLAIKREGFDVVLSGKFTTDADTGQVPPEIAELLGIPQVTSIRKMDFLEDDEQGVVVERETDEGYEVVQCSFPVLLTAGEYMPRRGNIPWSPEEMEEAGSKPIETIKAVDLSEDDSLFGVEGSPTSVLSIYPQERDRAQIVVKDETPEVAAGKLADYLLERGLFGKWELEEQPTASLKRSSVPKNGNEVWVYGEVARGEIRSVSLELLGKGAEMADRLEAGLAAVVVGADVGPYIETLAAYGAESVYVGQHSSFEPYTAEAYAEVLIRAVENHKPSIVLFPATANGRDLAPRIAARLQLGLTGDCIGMEIDDDGNLVQLKPAFGGNIVAPILSRTRPQMATVRPGVLARANPDWSRRATVRNLEVGRVKDNSKRVLGVYTEASGEGVDLDDAEAIVCVGMGIGGPKNISTLKPLIEVLDASLAASLQVCKAGWLPVQYQVGLTGKSVRPKLYIGIGISGQFNHLAGIRKSGIIAVINNDPEAPFFQSADFGIVGDYTQVVPALTEVLKKAKASKRTEAYTR